VKNEESSRNHGGLVSSNREEAALGEEAAARSTGQVVLGERFFFGFEAVVFGEGRREKRDAGVEEVTERALFFPEEMAGEGKGFPSHVFCEFRFPFGEGFGIWLKVFKMVEIEPFRDEGEGLFDGARVAEHAFDLLTKLVGII